LAKVERVFVLGIDPGLTRCGYGVVERRPRDGGLKAHACGVIRTPAEAELPARLATLNRELRGLLAEFRPQAVVVERVFFQTNVRTAMSVGQASGLALVAAVDAGADVAQYTANEVKQAVTGYGAATKEQVGRMVQSLLGLAVVPKPADAADALALALTHLAVHRVQVQVQAQAARR
jgi:crossover junction endodeoxyribonuclease RuvC